MVVRIVFAVDVRGATLALTRLGYTRLDHFGYCETSVMRHKRVKTTHDPPGRAVVDETDGRGLVGLVSGSCLTRLGWKASVGAVFDEDPAVVAVGVARDAKRRDLGAVSACRSSSSSSSSSSCAGRLAMLHK